MNKGWGKALRAFHNNLWQHRLYGSRRQPSHARVIIPSAFSAGAGIMSAFGRSLGVRVGTGMVVCGGTVYTVTSTKSSRDEKCPTDDITWVRALAERLAVEEVLSPGQMLRQNPAGKIITDDDHLFDMMVQTGQISEFRCFYDKDSKEFHSVVALGKDVCGFPQTVHGGLTAAILDETFGGLCVSVWKEGALGFRPPAYTARLEVDYKKKIPAISTILFSAELESIEDRKCWMKATVTNGEGEVYAIARALFIAPCVKKMALGWLGAR